MELRDQADAWLSAFSLDSDAELLEESPELFGVPWPPRNNAISNLLAAAGVGRRIEVEYLRDGRLRQGTFVSSYGEPDFQNAETDRFPAVGIDVKPVTYEVARYFGRPDQSGVIVSRVREGSRAGIAGLCRYLLITHADGRKISGLADFQEKISAFEKGRIDSTELTVEFFGRTRLVRLR